MKHTLNLSKQDEDGLKWHKALPGESEEVACLEVNTWKTQPAIRLYIIKQDALGFSCQPGKGLAHSACFRASPSIRGRAS